MIAVDSPPGITRPSSRRARPPCEPPQARPPTGEARLRAPGNRPGLPAPRCASGKSYSPPCELLGEPLLPVGVGLRAHLVTVVRVPLDLGAVRILGEALVLAERPVVVAARILDQDVAVERTQQSHRVEIAQQLVEALEGLLRDELLGPVPARLGRHCRQDDRVDAVVDRRETTDREGTVLLADH